MATSDDARGVQLAGGRGARERILVTASRLFRDQGINTTGIDELAARASVSKRTLYKHFGSKDALVDACLRRYDDEALLPLETVLDREDLPPRERLLAIFPTGDGGTGVLRGCPFVNAAVEVPDHEHPVHRRAAEHKRGFRERLVAVAAEAGVADPELVGLQLAVLFDGVSAQTVVSGTADSAVAARAAAEALLG